MKTFAGASRPILLAGAITVGIGALIAFHRSSDKGQDVLRVAFPATKGFEFDPARILLDTQYMLLENLYSPLVDTDAKGGVVPGLANRITWDGSKVRLRLRSDVRTASGKAITVDDAFFSLKRLMVLAGNTHGNFKEIVCPHAKMKSIADDCEGLRTDGDEIVIEAGKRKDFLLPMLTAVDFAVIPRRAVDPVSLKIADYGETSGPFFVRELQADGVIRLAANPHHYLYAADMPQQIVFIRYDRTVPGAALAMLRDDKVDHLPTSTVTQITDALKLSAENQDRFSHHATVKIRELALNFTDRGLRELSQSRRESIAAAVRSAFKTIYVGQPGYVETRQFFPAYGFGALSAKQLVALESKTKDPTAAANIPFRLALLKSGSLEEWSRPLQSLLKRADIYREAPDYGFDGEATNGPHALISSVDTGFLEDIGLVSYMLGAGYFGLPKTASDAWISEYLALPERQARIEKLQALHYQALNRVVLVPLELSPFVALIRKPWRMQFPELFGDNPLWMIQRR